MQHLAMLHATNAHNCAHATTTITTTTTTTTNHARTGHPHRTDANDPHTVHRPERKHAPRESVVVGNTASKYTVVNVGGAVVLEESVGRGVSAFDDAEGVAVVAVKGASSTVRNLFRCYIHDPISPNISNIRVRTCARQGEDTHVGR